MKKFVITTILLFASYHASARDVVRCGEWFQSGTSNTLWRLALTEVPDRYLKRINQAIEKEDIDTFKVRVAAKCLETRKMLGVAMNEAAVEVIEN